MSIPKLEGLVTEEFSHPLTIAQNVAEKCRGMVKQAEEAVAGYVADKSPTSEAIQDLARHALRLAMLDIVFRSMRVEPTLFNQPDPEDVQDLVELLTIVPFGQLLDDDVLLLNPEFGESSRLVGGADADLIAGDLLADFKATSQKQMDARDLDQLLGYYFLGCRERQSDPTFPAVSRLGLYFTRYGHLWVQQATVWTDQPHFTETELWSIAYAEELGRRKVTVNLPERIDFIELRRFDTGGMITVAPGFNTNALPAKLVARQNIDAGLSLAPSPGDANMTWMRILGSLLAKSVGATPA